MGFQITHPPKNNGIIGSCAAIYFGANVIERHFTSLEEDQTKDGPVSITKKDLKEISIFSKLSNLIRNYGWMKNIQNGMKFYWAKIIEI